MTNANCLEGIACPACANDSLIHIETRTLAAVTDDGAETFGHMEWDAGSYAECPDCRHSGTLWDFHIEPATNPKQNQNGDPVMTYTLDIENVDIDALLAQNHAIGIVWDLQHIKDQRPDLTDNQAWEVLQEAQNCWERLNDPMLETIRQLADTLFPKLSGKASLRAQVAQIQRRIEALPETECTDPAAYGSVAAEIDALATLVKGA